MVTLAPLLVTEIPGLAADAPPVITRLFTVIPAAPISNPPLGATIVVPRLEEASPSIVT